MAKNVSSADIFGGMFQNIPAYENAEAQNRNKLRQEESEDGKSNKTTIKRSCLHEFSSFYGHPYRVIEDESMRELAESIREHGVVEPILVRPYKGKPDEYEIISGHRRNYAAGLAGLDDVPVHIRDLDDNEAAQLMVDSNNKREILLPSEKAWAYRTKAEAMRCQGKRTDLPEDDEKKRAGIKEVGSENKDSLATVKRYIRLTYLIPDLMRLVDEEKLTIGNGYIISFFSEKEQGYIVAYYNEHHLLPNKEQLTAMSEAKAFGEMDEGVIAQIMTKQEKAEKSKKSNITIRNSHLRQYFPENASMEYMEQVIFTLLERWAKEQENFSYE